jgi:DNA adenine methylase
MTIAAADLHLASTFVVGETLASLADIWLQIIEAPELLAAEYRRLWLDQFKSPEQHFNRVRAEFNRHQQPAKLLYLLARCVKNSPRFNPSGAFNQSADRRRRGMHPDKMRRELLGVHCLLADRASVRIADYELTIADATRGDLVYLDPPWEGTSAGRDRRYYQGVERERLIAALADLNRRRIRFLLSYDGRSGARTYGEPLPEALGLKRIELFAGRSSQATLNGRTDVTIESLYLSPALEAI